MGLHTGTAKESITRVLPLCLLSDSLRNPSHSSLDMCVCVFNHFLTNRYMKLNLLQQ